jgi:hypothetical protein
VKVVLNRSKFLEAFNLAASGASNQVKDVLGNVLIDATKGRLEASNGETTSFDHCDQGSRNRSESSRKPSQRSEVPKRYGVAHVAAICFRSSVA